MASSASGFLSRSTSSVGGKKRGHSCPRSEGASSWMATTTTLSPIGTHADDARRRAASKEAPSSPPGPSSSAEDSGLWAAFTHYSRGSNRCVQRLARMHARLFKALHCLLLVARDPTFSLQTHMHAWRNNHAGCGAVGSPGSRRRSSSRCGRTSEWQPRKVRTQQPINMESTHGNSLCLHLSAATAA